jgi:hypothetical protein
MILLSSFEHAFATAATDVVKTAHFIQTKIVPALKQAQANEQTVEAITSLIDPAAVNIERAAYAVLGVIIKAVEDAGSAAAGQGLNVQLDAAVVADVKAIIPAIKTAPSAAPAAAAATAVAATTKS